MGVVRTVCFGAAFAFLFVSTAAAQSSTGAWRSLGPDGGGILAIAPDPAFPNIVHVATEGGGVFRSTDNGTTWRAGVGFPTVETHTLEIAPSNRRILYAGTAKNGVFKSLDGGLTWSATSVIEETIGISKRVTGLAVSPRDPRVAYVMVSGFPRTLHKTIDGGASWTRIDTPGVALPAGLRIDPVAPETLYAFGPALIKSTDGGHTWTHIEPVVPGAIGPSFSLEALDLRIDPKNAATLYASFGMWGVYKSVDAGGSWTASNNGMAGLSGPFAAFAVAALWIDPGDSSNVYASAFCPQGNILCPRGALFRSSDRGATWTAAHNPRGNWKAAVLAVSRSSPATVFQGTNCSGPSGAITPEMTVCSTGLFRSTDAGTTWTAVLSGLRSVRVSDVAADPSNPATLIAAAQGGVFRSADGGATWALVDSSVNAKRIAVAPGARQMYVITEFSHNSVLTLASRDRGASWIALPADGLRDYPNPLLYTINDLSVTSAAAADILYAATNTGLFKSIDSGATWARTAATPDFKWVELVEVKPGDPSVVFFTLGSSIFGAHNLTLHRSVDGGLTSAPVALAGPVQSLLFDPSNASTIYAAVDPQGTCGIGDVYKSVDGGDTWTAMSNGLPRDAVPCDLFMPLSLAVEPSPPHRIFIGSIRGVYATADGAETWTALEGLGDTRVASVAVAGSKLLATSSRGVLLRDIACPITVSTPVAQVGPAGGPVTIGVTAPDECSWTPANDAASFVVTSPAVSTGSQTASLIVGPNPGAPRSGVVAFGDASVIVSQAATEMSIDRSSLRFTAASNGGWFVTKTAAQTIRLVQEGPGAVGWTVSANQPWVTASQTSGAGSAMLTIDVAPSGAPPIGSTAEATVTITPDTGQAPIVVAVGLAVVRNGASTAPIGFIDGPVDGATGITGSVPVTGWAIDDLDVVRVRILRDPVAGETTGVPVYIGDAALIDGARPDVAALFPALPRNTRAGWGYLLLTNMLPNRGDGTYTLHVVADDRDGHSTVLGSRTITCTNSTATVTFGAIDTPGQGQTVSGLVANYGWVLAPGAVRADPPGGGTVTVFVDGAPVGSPAAWASRPDLTALFPQAEFNGVSSALGVFGLDTTALANGVHTIAWVVTDSSGATEGIGSRFFTVSNGATLPATAAEPAHAVYATATRRPAAATIRGRRGFDLATPYQEYRADATGRITVRAEEIDRIELLIGAREGFLRAGGRLDPLPAGSHLDPSTGVFTWMPGPGFIGSYDFEFVTAVARHDVRIVLHPKGSNRVGPQVIVDLPAPTAQGRGPIVVGRAFFLAGWAADLDSGIDRGVDTVHVWAYPVNERGEREEPMFLGPAIYGGARPDVAAVYGDRFGDTGYGMVVNGLAPGAYDVAVFAFSTVRGNFAPAKVVRVIVR